MDTLFFTGAKDNLISFLKSDDFVCGDYVEGLRWLLSALGDAPSKELFLKVSDSRHVSSMLPLIRFHLIRE